MPTPIAWSPAFDVNFRNADGQTQLKFVQLRNGDFWVVWTDFQDTGVGSPAGTDLVGQRYNAFGERIGGEVRLNATLSAANEGNASLAAAVGSNEFFVVYERLNGDGSIDLRLERKNADGTHIDFVSIAIDPDNGATGIGFRNPQIAIANSVSGLIVYERTNSAGNTDLLGQRFNPQTGELIGSAFTVADLASDADNASITVTSSGGYALVFEGNGDLNARFIATDGTVGALLAPIVGSNIRDPSVAALADGRIAISYTNDTNGINLLVLNSNGTINANAGTISPAGTHSDSHVVRIDDDTVTVAWEVGTPSAIRMITYDHTPGTLTQSGAIASLSGASSNSDIAMIGLADGRFLIGYDDPEGNVQIRDPRGGPNSPAVYAVDGYQIGTPLSEIFTTDPTATIVHGGGGDDIITDGPGTQAQIFGGEGNDTIRLTFVDAAENADGGPGNDTLYYISIGGGGTTVDLGAGIATTGAVSHNVTNFENFELESDIAIGVNVTAGAAAAILRTALGNDTLDLGAGGGTMFGGDGNDTYRVDSALDLVVESAGPNGGVDIVRASVSYSLPLFVENLTYVGAAAATLRGNTQNNVIIGGPQSDLFMLHDGGDDSASGGGGADGFFFGSNMTSADAVDGGAGTDQIGLQGEYANLILGANATVGVELVVLLPGNDNRFGGATATDLDYNITTVDANVAAGQVLTFQANTLRATETFTLNASAELDGVILTFGGLGRDILTGGQQGDGFYFGTGRFNAQDFVNGQGGSDQIGFQGNFAGANALTFGVGQISGVEFLVFLSASDTRFGGGAVGQSFSYTATMNDGNVAAGQTMIIQANTLRSGEVLTFDGSAESNGAFRLFGGAGDDVIIGGSLADELQGGAGSDQITGGGGADLLRGGSGSDRFNYAAITESTAAARDRILDFDSGDAIVLTNVDANSNVAGTQAFQLIASGQAFTAAGQLRITQTGNFALVEGDSNGDGAADFAIEVTTTGGLTLGAGSIFGLAPNAEPLKEAVPDSGFVRDFWPWWVRDDPHHFFAGVPSDLLI